MGDKGMSVRKDQDYGCASEQRYHHIEALDRRTLHTTGVLAREAEREDGMQGDNAITSLLSTSCCFPECFFSAVRALAMIPIHVFSMNSEIGFLRAFKCLHVVM